MKKEILTEVGLGSLCFINTEGKIIIEIKEDYDEIHYPSNGFCVVGKNGQYGYIDERGKVQIPLIYNEAYDFAHNGLAFAIGEDGLGGYIDKDGEFVIEPLYESGSSFKYGFAAVSKDGEYIFIYRNGDKAINHTFRYASEFSECGLAKIQEFDGRQGLIDTESRIVLMLKNGCELEEFIGGSKVTKFKKDGKEALINSKGEIITGLKYDKIIISPDSNLNPFLRDGLWGYIDDEGNEVIANIYLSASEFTEHKLALVSEANPLGKNKRVSSYINDKGETIDNRLMELFYQSFDNEFSRVYEFKKGLALAIKKPKRGNEGENSSHGSNISGEIIGLNENSSEEYTGYEEFKGYYDEEGIPIGVQYAIEINFKDMDKGSIHELIKEELCGTTILDIRDNYVKLLVDLIPYFEPEEYEVTMYYFLNDGELGDYDYYRVN